MPTRTGSFPIGFRRANVEWQRDLRSLAHWSRESGFDAMDLTHAAGADDFRVLADAGLALGSVDVLEFPQVMSSDPGRRKEVLEKNLAFIKDAAAGGARKFFTCVIPGEPSQTRADNYRLSVECFAPLAHACAAADAFLAIEGWPGGPPHYANLCCTPETVRQFLKDVGRGVGLNYDPSHLVRLRVDPIRFLQEFAEHVKHVHAKDTEVDQDALYEFGAQPATFAQPHRWGEWTWRYTLPGHGLVRWGEIFKVLKESGYKGAVSVELEDENFNGSEEGEKRALLASLAYLREV